MSGGPSMRVRAMLLFELAPALKGPLPWAALAGLLVLVVPIRFVMSGEIHVANGELIGKALRVNTVLVVGYSTIAFLTTLFTLSFCLDRTGPHYMRNNDLLILSRDVGRPAFFLAKMASVLIPSLAYGILAITVFWGELLRIAGIDLHQVFLLIFPLGLSMACIVGLYFLMRNFMGNFMIFFLWLLFLPVSYVVNLWRYYGNVISEAGPVSRIIGMLPQFGGVHAWSLGLVSDSLRKEHAWHALANMGLWAAISMAAGFYLFTRKRL
jgi:hypothetical protein